jgi:hypothetical protein
MIYTTDILALGITPELIARLCKLPVERKAALIAALESILAELKASTH